jgi:biopolymer transport protein ExbD
MARERRAPSRLESNINITPMGDVSLCLLLGFLVITPIIIETLSANLPQAGGVSSGQLKQDPVVVLTAEGHILVDDEEIAFEALPAKMEELFPPGVLTERKVMFTGSGEVEYQEVIKVLDKLRELGVETFGIR